MRLALPALLTLFVAPFAPAQNHVAPTDPKSPADELKTFKLPPGFAAQLVAAEPDIGKPIQIAFDARGRLWVTTSHHYPFPASPGPGTDKLYVLSDFGPDGKAKKVTTFAADLNIPIGILPLPDCNSCLVSSVGEVLKLTDTDGDGKADKREVILTGVGYKDTHGMVNSFTLLPDGWVYACHGFSNDSHVKAKDGSGVHMQSGNTFRFRPDGSHVEPWTYGQVNPFGMTVDPWLNLYNADCHSKPITQLIRGGYYSSFGKPHDGLGYAPDMINHDHGSTALCGLAWYDAGHFPPQFKDTMFLGNVVTNRINFDKIEFVGSTPKAVQQPDFLVSSDPWFRPTDIKLGPDGALYFADFYNRIIGHYEVDLKHPGRDKDRGRVWRIVWQGEAGKAKPPVMPGELTNASLPELEGLTRGGSLTTRLQVVQELIRRGDKGEPWEPPAADAAFSAGSDRQRGGYDLWARYRLGAAKPDFRNVDRLAPFDAVMGCRLAGAFPDLTDADREAMYRVLTGRSPRAARAAAEALIINRHPDNVAPLVTAIAACPADDTHLRYAARIALRNALRDANGWDAAAKVATTPAAVAVIADVALGVPSKESAGFLLKQLKAGRLDPPLCEHVGRFGDDGQTAAVVEVLKAKRAEQPAAVLGLQALFRGVQARGAHLPPAATPVIEAVCGAGLEAADPTAVQASADLVAGLKLTTLFDPLTKLAGRADRNENLRGTALNALMAIDPAKAAPVVGRALTDPAAPAGLRDRAAQVLAGSNQPAGRDALLAALPTAPARFAGVIAVALAGSPQGAIALLDAVKAGKASARLLQEKAVAAKLATIDGGKLKPRLDDLTRGLPSADAKLDALIHARADGFRRAKPDVEVGKKVFAQHYAACHQVGGQGAKVGPQLDGIGNRGADRLCEDILDPNRNVDAAFRATVVSLADGRTVTGLLLRDEGQVMVFADATGKEVRVPAADVEKKAVSPLSPMPANFDTAVPEADFYHLLAYLADLRAKDKQ